MTRLHSSIPTAFKILLLVTLFTPVAVTAQGAPGVLAPPPAGQVQRLTLRDGSEVIGRILAVDSVTIRFESALGMATIPIGSIADVVLVDPEGFAFRNPNATRLFFAPTGRMLKKGEGYFSDFYIFFPGLNVGITDRVSLGGMMSVFPGAALDEQLYFLTPKVGVVQSANTNAAVGALVMHVPGDDIGDGTTAGIAYGVNTFGSEDRSLTLGAGLGFVDGIFQERPFMMLGGETRVSDRLALVSENWILPGGEFGILSAGVRFLGRGMAVDFGFMRPVGSASGGSATIPILGFQWKW